MIFEARRLLVAAAAFAVGGCGGGVHDLSVSDAPLLVVHGHVDVAALQRVDATAPLLGTLVWADLPGVNPVCLELDDPRIRAGCPDPYGIFQGVLTGAVETPVAIGDDGNFDVALFHVPKARYSIGDDVTRIAYGALVVFEDDDRDSSFSVLVPGGGGPGRQMGDQITGGPPDTILGSTFWSLRADQQRLAFREGGFDQGSFFYPIASNDLDPSAPTFPDACVPPPGFSILAASPYGPTPTCSFPPLDTRMEVPPLQNQDGLALMCRSVQRGATIQLPQQDEAPGPGAFCPAHADHPDREVMVMVLNRFCAHLNVYALKGCGADPFCDTPEWDVTASPPTWWRPICP